jgi:hypothetical protein
MNFLSCPWLWMYAGAILMLLELLAPGFVIFFFGLSAATVGLCRFAFGSAFDLTWQLAAFSAFSIVYLVFLRQRMKKVFSGTVETSRADFQNDNVGRIGKVTVAVNPPLAGRVLVGDAEWNAVSEAALAVGADVRVVAQDNLTMKVEAL